MKNSDEKSIFCPRCGHNDVYFSCEIGFYCTACGHRFNSSEARLFVEQQVYQTKVKN